MPIPALPLFKHRDTIVTPADQNQFVTQFENTMDTMSNGVIPALNLSINDMNTQYNNIYNNLPFAPDSGYSQAYINNNFVKLIGNQTIEGIKTFTSSPIVPTPTTDFQVATKQYTDDSISNIQTLPIGAILNGYTIFDNCIVAFGGEFNRADYPKLWAYLQANPSLVKTQTQWQVEATANGGICGFFSDGNGTTTFRVPNLDKAFLRPDSRGVASYQGDAIRNITGKVNGFDLPQLSTNGAFYYGNQGNRWNISGTVSVDAVDLFFDASKVVPISTENRPKNIAVLPLIVAK